MRHVSLAIIAAACILGTDLKEAATGKTHVGDKATTILMLTAALVCIIGGW